jgi:CBS domain containing-hemolysin-like protein
VTALLLIAVVALVFVNGFFVAAEFALVRARRSRIEALAAEGARGAKAALAELEEITEYLSACQLGITLASIGIGFLGEPAIATLIEPLFGGVSDGVAVAISVLIAYLLVTSLHITVGEQVPKVYAIQRAERTVVWVARPLKVFAAALGPFVRLLNWASNGLLRLVGIRGEDLGEETLQGIEDLKLTIAESHRGGHLEANEAGMLSGVFHLHEQEARQVMTPIPAVVTVDVSEDVETAMRRCISSGHTRLVVTEDGSRDRIRGLVHANSLAKRFMADGPGASIEVLVHDAPIVPETKPLDDLLAELQRLRTSLAVVVDEYGRTAGIVTVEDIVEEVVGEIDDETDPAGGEVRQLPNGDWFVRGHVAVTDLHDYGLGLPVDTDAYNSVGGFVFATLGRLPRRGDTVDADGYSIRVESVRDNRIEAVRIRPRDAED